MIQDLSILHAAISEITGFAAVCWDTINIPVNSYPYATLGILSSRNIGQGQTTYTTGGVPTVRQSAVYQIDINIYTDSQRLNERAEFYLTRVKNMLLLPSYRESFRGSSLAVQGFENITNVNSLLKENYISRASMVINLNAVDHYTQATPDNMAEHVTGAGAISVGATTHDITIDV